MNKAPGPTRRGLLKSIAGLLATDMMPVAKLLPLLESATAKWSEELTKALPLVRALKFSGVFEPFNTITSLVTGPELLVHRFETEEEAFGAPPALDSFSARLPLAWQFNIHVAVMRAGASEMLQSIAVSDISINPARVFSLLGQKENRTKIVHFLFEQEHGIPIPPDRFAGKSIDDELGRARLRHIENAVDRISASVEKYPQLRQANTMDQMIGILRKDITEALSLPLDENCFGRLENLRDVRNIKYLLQSVPELIPEGRASLFQRLAEDLEINGRPTLRLKDETKPKNEWRFSANNLAYRMGLTSLQVSRGNMKIRVIPAKAGI